MQVITIDLTKTPEIADEVAGMEPGDEVCLHATIKSLDPQTLVVTVEELSVPKDEDTAEKPTMGNEGSDAAETPVETPPSAAPMLPEDSAV